MSVRAAAFTILLPLGLALLAPRPAASAPKLAATEASIDHVELTNNVLYIHFYTLRSHSYTLQGAFAASSTNWTNLRFVPPSFRDDHAILSDPLTNAQRFYRLYVVP